MGVKDSDWSVFYASFLIAAVLGGLLVLTSWGGYGTGTATAFWGVLITIAAMMNCCCSKQQCLDRWPCHCCSCADCNELKPIFHARNLIVISGIFALIGSIIVLLVSLAFTFSGDCKHSYCHSLRGPNNCKQCWDPTWTSHPHERWEWGLSEMCWASDLRQDIFRKKGKHHDDLSFGCHWHWTEDDDHDHDRFKQRGPKNNAECKQLCSCMGGDYEECGDELVFGIVGLLNGFFGVCFVIASFCACMAAGRIIQDSGGPQASAMRFVAPPMTGQVVGQPVGLPVVVVADTQVVESNPACQA